MKILAKGIDISYWQNDIDFNKVKESGIDFVILREGYRHTTDKKFMEYVKGCKEAGINILGIYHFSYALNLESAVEEARFAVSNLEKAGLPKSTLVFFDFEYDTVAKAAANGVNLTRKECNSHTIAFCEQVEALGYTAGVYTNIDFHKNWYDEDTLESYEVWLADYTGEPNYECAIQQYSNAGNVPGINGKVDMNYLYKNFKIPEDSSRKRDEVVELAKSWFGLKEYDGSYRKIIDIYNSYDGELPRGVKMEYEWPWCACTWSAVAIALGYTDIMPIEISCGNLIKLAEKMGIWVEDDAYIPKPGDAVLYDWQDDDYGDNMGWSDHIGIVTMIDYDAQLIEVIEGNYHNQVDYRLIHFNQKYIRGFITPKYDEEPLFEHTRLEKVRTAIDVIDGKYGNGEERKRRLTEAGYDYSEIQKYVNALLS